MKLLIDANLSYRLSKRLGQLFETVIHVERTGLPIPASDIDIWNWARENEFLLLLTRDDDFAQIQQTRGFPPKIIILRIRNRSTPYVAALLEKHFQAIIDLSSDEEQGLLEIFELDL
jgi:predicted nuclease of predicted toxin-antitoxin system